METFRVKLIRFAGLISGAHCILNLAAILVRVWEFARLGVEA